MRTPTRAGCRFRAAAARRAGMRPLPAWPQALASSGTAPRDTRRRHGPMKISSFWQHGRQTPTLAPLSRVPDSESRSSSSTPVSTARSHACLRATRQWAMRSPQGAARPTSTGDGRLIRRGAASGKFSSISSTASLLVVRRTHGSGVRPLGPGAAVGSHPAAGPGSAARTRCPDAGSGNAASSRSRPRRARSARPGSCADTMRGVTKIASSVSRN